MAEVTPPGTDREMETITSVDETEIAFEQLDRYGIEIVGESLNMGGDQ